MLVFFKLKYVVGSPYFGNSRGLAPVMMFLPFCMNIIKKIHMGTCLLQYNIIVLSLFIEIYGLVTATAYLNN